MTAAVDATRPTSDVRPKPRRFEPLAIVWLVAIGIALRLLVLLAASPFNPDRHIEVVQYIRAFHTLPTSNLLDQSYQPPLYYLLMAVVYAASGMRVEAVHVGSFVLSVANLLWIVRLMRDEAFIELVPRPAVRVLGFAILATLPELIMFAGFISNDTLTMLVGTLIVAASLRYLAKPTIGRCALLALAVAVGLLTKGTFLLTGPALAIVVTVIESRRRTPAGAIGVVVAFCAIWLTLGSYKYIENTIRLGRPIVHNQDNENPTSLSQRNTWQGWQTAVDVNVLKLIRAPVIDPRRPLSYPLLLYGTFWYQHIPESSFAGNLRGYDRVGSAIYAVAIVPTLAFVVGLVVLVRRTAARGRSRAVDVALTSLLLFASNAMVVLAAGLKYDNWSSFQSRLLFQSAVPMLAIFGVGASTILRSRVGGLILVAFGWATVGLAIVYFAVELGLTWGLLGGEMRPWPPA